MMQRTSQSIPVVRQPTLQTTLTSPAWNRLAIALRSGTSVYASMYSARQPAAKNCCCRFLAWARSTAKHSVGLPSARSSHVRHHIGDQHGLVHRLAEITLVIIARNGADTAQGRVMQAQMP